MAIYASHFNTRDGTTDGRVLQLGIPKRVDAPNIEGNPYKVGDWGHSSIRYTVGYDANFHTEQHIGIPSGSYFEIYVYDADNTTELTSFITPTINAELDITHNNIRVYVRDWKEEGAPAPIKNKALVDIIVLCSALLPSSGRFRTVIRHISSEGTFEVDQTLFYNPSQTSLAYVPKELQKDELFPYMCEIIDWAVDKYHTNEVNKLSALYNVEHPDFDPDYILKLFNFPLSEIFSYEVDYERKKSICLFISKIFCMKGTRKSLDYILSMLDLKCTIYEWYYINEQRALGNNLTYFSRNAEQCSIWLDFGVIGNYPVTDEFEEQLLSLIKTLLWVCVKIDDISWRKIFIDHVYITTDLTITTNEIVYTEYSPYKANCAILVYGYPIHPNHPRFGDENLVYTSNNVLRFIPDYMYTEIDYNGSDTHTGKHGKHYETEKDYYFGDTGITFGGMHQFNPLLNVKVKLLYGPNKVFSHIEPGTRLFGACDISIIEVDKTVDLGVTDLSPGDGILFSSDTVHDGKRFFRDRAYDSIAPTYLLDFENTIDKEDEVTITEGLDFINRFDYEIPVYSDSGKYVHGNQVLYGEQLFESLLQDRVEHEVVEYFSLNPFVFGDGSVFSMFVHSAGTNEAQTEFGSGTVFAESQFTFGSKLPNTEDYYVYGLSYRKFLKPDGHIHSLLQATIEET